MATSKEEFQNEFSKKELLLALVILLFLRFIVSVGGVFFFSCIFTSPVLFFYHYKYDVSFMNFYLTLKYAMAICLASLINFIMMHKSRPNEIKKLNEELSNVIWALRNPKN